MRKFIPIAEIQEGMIISEPIINSFGHTLLAAGTQLRANHANLLKSWNIQAVAIKVDQEETEFVISDELKALAEERVKKRISWEPRNQFDIELQKVCFLQAVNIISKRFTS